MRFVRPEQMVLAPLAQRHDHSKQTLAFGGQDVLLIRGAIRRWPHLHNTPLDQAFTAMGQDTARDAQATLKIAKTANTLKRVAHDQ